MTSQPSLGFTHRFEPATAHGTPHLLLLHGTGGDENSLIALGQAIAPGAALLSPRGPIVEQGMARFFRRPEQGVFDRDELATRTQEIVGFVEQAAAAYKIPASKFVAVGFSNGAVMAANLFLHSPKLFGGALLMRGMTPFAPDHAIDLERRPVLLLCGDEDPFVGTDEVAELANVFRAANAEVTLHWENAGHTLCQGDYLMAFDWMRQFFTPVRNTK